MWIRSMRLQSAVNRPGDGALGWFQRGDLWCPCCCNVGSQPFKLGSSSESSENPSSKIKVGWNSLTISQCADGPSELCSMKGHTRNRQ